MDDDTKIDLSLFEILRSYPRGGLRGLSDDSGITESSLRRFAAGEHSYAPWGILHKLGHLDVEWPGAPNHIEGWLRLWKMVRDEAQ